MTREEYNRLVAEIELLPQGGITYKRINDRLYAYYQWRENGKQHSRRAKDEELDMLTSQIERRKELQKQLKESEIISEDVETTSQKYAFTCSVRMGRNLDNFVNPVAKWKKRECYKQLEEYIYGEVYDKVYILYGLRRTGKTTLIRQLILDMDAETRSKTVFIQVQANISLADVNRDLRYLEDCGFQYVFIDEVTLLEDFISGAALFSDVFAASGMKIVLSGTDSLGFMLAEDEELYDRCILSHTTFIPYREFEQVLGVTGIDNYIRYGGTMSLGGRNYNDGYGIFVTKKRTGEYVDSAIARNIQHSLKNYQYAGHFRSLQKLYEENELTSVINRIVEDINHRFTLEVLTKDFKSNDLSISAKNLRKDREKPTDILDQVDIDKVNLHLIELLEIKDKKEQTVKIEDSQRFEIKEYLDMLDITVEIENRWMSDYNKKETKTVFSQPGMRYSQAEALIISLLQDETFRDMSLEERKSVTERILNEVKGRMMEDIVLLETQLARKNCEVFRLQFAVGEYDMVVFDPYKGNCEIYEIKHSMEMVEEQCKHLLDERKCNDMEHRYGTILGKYVIYRGKSQNEEKVSYINVEEYLKNLAEMKGR